MKKYGSSIVGLLINLILIGLVIYALPTVTMKSFQLAREFVYGMEEDEDENKVSREVSITVPSGSTTKQIAQILKDNELISSVDWFTIKSKLNSYDGTFKKGDYSLNTSMTEEEIMDVLKAGTIAQAEIVFTIPEGYTVLKIAKKLEDEGIITAEEFVKAVNEGAYDYSFLDGIKERASLLEGYLFPDTYFFRKGSTADEIVSKLLSRFEEIYSDKYVQAAQDKGYTMDQVIIMASIIEKEAKLKSEQTIMAGVINNRLALKMALQMDSTVNYAFELRDGVNSGRDEEEVLLTDLEIESLYNTYANVGLPVGPICNPGQDAIEAVLYPDHNNYVYFVLKDRATGEHEFTETYEQHLAAKSKYQQ